MVKERRRMPWRVVGGNRFKGGTGGADTAGLGGKGGPYRIDAGFEVHQVTTALHSLLPLLFAKNTSFIR